MLAHHPAVSIAAFPLVPGRPCAAFNVPQVIDYYRKKGAVSDIKADQESKRVAGDIATVLKDSPRS